jgi:Domain of unknown function (DUF4136)
MDTGAFRLSCHRSDPNFIDAMAAIRYHLSIILVTVSCLFLVSCASVDQPKGTSKGYKSARLIQRDPQSPAITDAVEKQVHGMIQRSIARQFSNKGLDYGGGGADLTVAYLVIYQEPGMTATYPAFFGYGRSAEQIADYAHTRGVLKNQRPDYFRQAGIVMDVIDSRTGELVYRGFSKGDVIKNASAATRSARIDAAVADGLAAFFR